MASRLVSSHAPAGGGNAARRGGTLRIPREHGAWSVLVTSLLAGSAVGGRLTPAVLVLWATVIAGFVGWPNAVAGWTQPGERRVSAPACRWAVLLLGAAAAGCAWLALGAGYRALPVLLAIVGGCALWLGARTQHIARSLWAELAGIAGLSVLAAAAQYTAAGRLSVSTLGIWLLCLFVFIGSVLHVRFLVRGLSARRHGLRARLRAGVPLALYHTAALGVLGVLCAGWRVVPPAALLVFSPSVIKALWGLASPAPRGPLQIRRIGRTELAYAVVFVLLVLLSAPAWSG